MHRKRNGKQKEAMENVNVDIPTLGTAGTIRLKVQEKMKVVEGSLIAAIVTGPNGQERPILAPKSGTIVDLRFQDGAEIDGKAPTILCAVKYCPHAMILGKLCAVCGAKIDSGSADKIKAVGGENNGSEDWQKVNIKGGHTVSLNSSEAQRMWAHKSAQLKRSRKLALVLDLDHTLIHATADGRLAAAYGGCGRRDVREIRFPLPTDAPGGGGAGARRAPAAAPAECSHWVKLRPGVLRFLEEAARLCELSVYTHGARAYAEAVAAVLDPGGRLGLAGRLVSRTDAPDLRGEKRLARLFPGGREMALILDDREDVWRGQLDHHILVRPYKFFHTAAEVNNHAGILPGVSAALTAPPHPPPPEALEKAQGKTPKLDPQEPESGKKKTKEEQDGQAEAMEQDGQEKSPASSPPNAPAENPKEGGSKLSGESSPASTSDERTKADGPKPGTPEAMEEQDGQAEAMEEDGQEKSPATSPPNAPAENPEEGGSKPSGESSPASTSDERTKADGPKPGTPEAMEEQDGQAEAMEEDGQEKSPATSPPNAPAENPEEGGSKPSGESSPASTPAERAKADGPKPGTPEAIEALVQENDPQLERVTAVLQATHAAFYGPAAGGGGGEGGGAAGLGHAGRALARARGRVLAGCALAFSGLVKKVEGEPAAEGERRLRAHPLVRHALALGARVGGELDVRAGGTTHLVATNPGTAKARAAAAAPGLRVVHPDWLAFCVWHCRREDERPFLLCPVAGGERAAPAADAADDPPAAAAVGAGGGGGGGRHKRPGKKRKAADPVSETPGNSPAPPGKVVRLLPPQAAAAAAAAGGGGAHIVGPSPHAPGAGGGALAMATMAAKMLQEHQRKQRSFAGGAAAAEEEMDSDNDEPTEATGNGVGGDGDDDKFLEELEKECFDDDDDAEPEDYA